MITRLMIVATILAGLAGYGTHKTSPFNTSIDVTTTLIGCGSSIIGIPSFHYCEYKGNGIGGEFPVSSLEYKYNQQLIGKPYVVTIPHPRRWLFFTFLSIWIISMLTIAICYVTTKPTESHYPE